MIRNTLVQAASAMEIELSDEQIGALVLYAEELKKWNRKINLTAISSDREIAVKHLVDALCMARLLKDAERLLDIGSGAGIPSVPLKIALPDLEIVSVDAVGKKVHFQRHITRLLNFERFKALHTRVEELVGGGTGLFDVITSRAFSDLALFARLAVPLLADEGRIIAMKGPAVKSELEAAHSALEFLGCAISSIDHYSLPFNNGERCLITIRRNKTVKTLSAAHGI